ncbi:MAG: hypothetical protein WDN72_04085 [Alphaproteobacteria bacterium]
MNGVIRKDLIQKEEDPRFDTLLFPVMLTPRSDLALRAPELEKADAYMTLSEAAEHNRQSRPR